MKNYVAITGISLFLICCDQKPCQNTNEILNQNSIDSEIYISELINLIENSNAEINYWFNSYIQEGENEYILLDIQSENICAQGKFLVHEWTGIEQIKKVKGKSYQGSRLKGFKFEVDTLNDNKILHYKSVENIID